MIQVTHYFSGGITKSNMCEKVGVRIHCNNRVTTWNPIPNQSNCKILLYPLLLSLITAAHPGIPSQEMSSYTQSQPQIIQNFGEILCSQQFNPTVERLIINTQKSPTKTELNFLEKTCSLSINCSIFSKMSVFHYSLKWEFTSIITCKASIPNSGLPLNPELELFYKGAVLQLKNPTFLQQKYIRITQPNLRRDTMNKVSKMELRDFHNLGKVHIFIPLGKMAYELFLWTNKTVLTIDDPFPPDVENILFPTLHPHLSSSVLRSMDWNASYNKSIHHVRSFDINYNFAYCSDPKRSYSSLYNISVLSAPFVPLVWILLFGTMLTLSFVLLRRFRVQDLGSIIFVLVADLILIPASHTFPSTRYSLLHVGWLLLCVLLSNLYTGQITSLLIKPVEEQTLGELEDLVDRNFTVVFPKFLPTILVAIKEQLAGKEALKTIQKRFIYIFSEK
ncbi:unnamed protein product [Orchesella dallaii]|uniref:Uncharacterized protein n=1 Tax=Orchesella dallaii TaxID=48710 RepID=A0ABP1QPG0_9HEXA